MKEKILDKAKFLGLEVYQNSSDKWIIKGSEKNLIWLLEEKEEDTWLMTFNQIPEMVVKTDIVIRILDMITIRILDMKA